MKQLTVKEITEKPSLMWKAIPFELTYYGKVVAEIVAPGSTTWKKCENCGNETQGVITFKDKEQHRHTLILCDECSQTLL